MQFNHIDKTLDPAMAKELFDLLPLPYCRVCRIPLPKEIGYYPHSDGWTHPAFKEKQWFYVQCKECGFQFSLWKLGYGRTPEETAMQKERVLKLKTDIEAYIKTHSNDLADTCPKCHSHRVKVTMDDDGQYYAQCQMCHNSGIMTYEDVQKHDRAVDRELVAL